MGSESVVDDRVEDARAIFNAAVRRVQADQLLTSVDAGSWAPLSLDSYDQVGVVGMGKAAMAMAGVAEAQYPDRIVEGTVVVPESYPDTYPEPLPRPTRIEVTTGGHPLPSTNSESSARRLLEHARALDNGDLLLTLVSGGGTALVSLPAEGLELADLRTTYHRLLTAGVPIEPANVVRKHLTQLGGGQLAQAAHPADVGALVVSDVVGDKISVIASGPTIPDPSTYEDAIRVLYRHDLWHDIPDAIRSHLVAGSRGQTPETPKAGAPCFERVETTLVGANATALEAARIEAEERGYRVHRVTTEVEGEAREIGRAHVSDMTATDLDEPTCWLWGGETTVTVTGSGKGGRNQEVALGAALGLEDASSPAVLLSGGTDGIDGPTDAAGAWATPNTAERARAEGCDPEAHLAENDAYPLFDAIEHLLRTGPTHTNVMDVHVGLVRPDE